ncbi:carboxylate-amine ligase [Sulfitobacter sabulilitoris]|uniref:Putative glutamate--cysteine ligase 2 n=1 Tax=Sulfitobacter sabulilitoris TaxID=2562655 RepID=A0A5S3PLA3_9RHOB|nr:carboxylate-amine ligase [Sulfitobacter sabulilitoris]TMM54340.1 carboxylate-amine ligase [Sulfitobacter sabulilitoris]
MQTEFTMGIEEEYLLVDKDSLALARAPDALMEACRADLQDQVSPEFLDCQIEIGTRVCKTIAEARADLRYLRATVARHAADHNLAPIAASCHPFSRWRAQSFTQKERYSDLEADLAGVARRMLICGMHVHVGVDDDSQRVDLMPQLSYFLPHLLALSTSSPFWQGQDTGLASYRLSVFDNMPRTGLPPEISSWAAYERTTGTLIDLGVIDDPTEIWWDLRPSHSYPTLETRICDVSPRMEDALSIAALTQALVRRLVRLRDENMRWRDYDRFLISENRWRAQRYGITEPLIDFGERSLRPFAALLDDMLELVAQDADQLGCRAEVERLRMIVEAGTSATRQRSAHAQASGDATARGQAVVRHLIEEYHADL